MKNIDPIKDMSARELAEKMIDDLDYIMESLIKATKNFADSDVEQQRDLYDKMAQVKYATDFIKEYVKPIKATIVDEYNSLKTAAKQKAFIEEQLKIVDPLELLASGLLTADQEGVTAGITIPGDPGKYWIDWLITEVGSGYVKIMTDSPIPDGKGKIVYPTVIIGNGMDADEVINEISKAIKGTTLENTEVTKKDKEDKIA